MASNLIRTYGDFTIPDLSDGALLNQIWNSETGVGRLTEVKPTAGPGFPLSSFGRTNREVLESHASVVISLAYDKLAKFVNLDVEALGLSEVELIKANLLDIYRVFVKQEPHGVHKSYERTIASVPLHTQVVERILFGGFHESVVANYAPGALLQCGIGFSDELGKSMYDYLKKLEDLGIELRSDDMPNWDFSVLEWLNDDNEEVIREMILRSSSGHLPSRDRCLLLLKNLFYLRKYKFYALSDGRVVTAGHPGGTISGLFDTSDGNCIKRTLLHKNVDFTMGGNDKERPLFAMGDDCSYQNLPGCGEVYAKFGFQPKDVNIYPTPAQQFEFCSHGFRSGNPPSLVSWARSLYRLLGKEYDNILFEQFMYEIRGNSNKLEILLFLEDIGYLDGTKIPHLAKNQSTPQLSVEDCQRKIPMPKVAKNVKTQAKHAANGQRNDQKAIAKMGRRIDQLESRTISSQKAAAESNRFADTVRGAQALSNHKAPNPRVPVAMVLTPEEEKYHAAMKTGGSSELFELVNNNIEASERVQHWKGLYEFDVTVASNDATQINILSAADYDAAGSDTPKSFASRYTTNGNGLGVSTIPAPCGNGASSSGAVLTGSTGAADQVVNATTSFTGGAATARASNPACPFVAVNNVGSNLRWQLCRIGVKVINRTIGSNRAGIATLIQTTNPAYDLAAVHTLQDYNGRGIYRAFKDLEVCEKHTEDGFVYMGVREGLRSFHHLEDSAGINGLEYSAAIIHLSGNVTASQQVRVFLKLDWYLAGTVVRGIAIPHVVSGEVQDRSREVNEVMRSAGIMPSQQTAGEHIAAAAALYANKGLQAALGHYKTLTSDHPAVKAVRGFLGKHVGALAASGFSAAVHALAPAP